MSVSMSIPKNVLSGRETTLDEYAGRVLDKASEHYGFDSAEARELFLGVSLKKSVTKRASGVKKAKTVARPSVVLPFVGVVDENLCYGIRFNHGLHTQCQKACSGDYCASCQKEADSTASGKPKIGDIRDRLACGLLEFRDAKGRQTMPYANVVKKLKLDRDVCMSEAVKFGVEIPAEHWVERVARRGRPKKGVDVSDTESDGSSVSKKSKSAKHDALLKALVEETADDGSSVSSKSSGSSKRGRPRLSDEEKARRAAAKADAKAAKAAEREAAKVAKADAKAAKAAEREAAKAAKAEAKASKASKASEPESVPCDDDESVSGCDEGSVSVSESVSEDACEDMSEEMEVEQFVYEGVTYLKDDSDNVYNESLELVGGWDPEAEEVVLLEGGFLTEDEMSDDDE